PHRALQPNHQLVDRSLEHVAQLVDLQSTRVAELEELELFFSEPMTYYVEHGAITLGRAGRDGLPRNVVDRPRRVSGVDLCAKEPSRRREVGGLNARRFFERRALLPRQPARDVLEGVGRPLHVTQPREQIRAKLIALLGEVLLLARADGRREE